MTKNEIREMARKQWAGDDLEIDEDAYVLILLDEGAQDDDGTRAWVQAWVYVKIGERPEL